MVRAVVRVLFVCTGNICRSPTAEGVFADLVQREGLAHAIATDSAGTMNYHEGSPADSRSQQAAARRGIALGSHRARMLRRDDYWRFDLLLAMSPEHRNHMLEECPPQHHDKIRMFLEFAPHLDHDEVPDPYYGGTRGFDLVLDMVEQGSAGLLRYVVERWSPT